MKSEKRFILAPHFWPLEWPLRGELPPGCSIYYISWPGWEDIIAQRQFDTDYNFIPLILHDETDKPGEFKNAFEHLIADASQPGPVWFNLMEEKNKEELAEIRQEIKKGSLQPEHTARLQPRLVLALWAWTIWQASDAAKMLAEVAVKEKYMWARLKGEELIFSDLPNYYVPRPLRPDQQKAIWSIWCRLALNLINDSDVLVLPTDATVDFLIDAGFLDAEKRVVTIGERSFKAAF